MDDQIICSYYLVKQQNYFIVYKLHFFSAITSLEGSYSVTEWSSILMLSCFKKNTKIINNIALTKFVHVCVCMCVCVYMCEC